VLFINIYIYNELQRGKNSKEEIEQRKTKELMNYLYRSKRLEKTSFLAADILSA
jgi:hypothetical protein